MNFLFNDIVKIISETVSHWSYVGSNKLGYGRVYFFVAIGSGEVLPIIILIINKNQTKATG